MWNDKPNNLVFLGKGPLKEFYMNKVKEQVLPSVAITSLWLESADYPRLLGVLFPPILNFCCLVIALCANYVFFYRFCGPWCQLTLFFQRPGSADESSRHVWLWITRMRCELQLVSLSCALKLHSQEQITSFLFGR